MNQLPNDPLWACLESQHQQAMQSLALADLVALQSRPYTPPAVQKQGALAVVPVHGVLTKRPTLLQMLFGGSTYDQIAEDIARLAAMPSIDRIVLLFDSPGGTVNGCQECGDAIHAASKRKPITAQVDGTCASGAYWLASQCSDVVCSSTLNQVGSIGVRIHVYDFSKMFEKSGIRTVLADTGPLKSVGLEGTTVSTEQQEYLQGMVNYACDQFIQTVARGRRLSITKVKTAATGAVFYAEQAIQLGLVDRVQTFQETINTTSRTPSMTAASTTTTIPAPANRQTLLPAEVSDSQEDAAEFEAAVKTEMLNRGVSRMAAMQAVRRNNPGLFEAWQDHKLSGRPDSSTTATLQTEQRVQQNLGLAESHAQFEQLIEAEMKQHRCRREQAVGHAYRSNPQLAEAWRKFRHRTPNHSTRKNAR